MELLKFLFKEDEKQLVGLCGFKKEFDLDVFIPKFNPNKTIYSENYQNNFFLL